MNNILFDEKIAGSIHFTPGNCYEDAPNGNKSAIHWDLVLIMTPEYGGGEIWFDDVLIRKDGRFLLPELECLNAVPTAEGCLQLLLRLRQYTVWESEFLVLGYGRIGAAVAQRLLALGGRVTVAARRAEQLAYARCAGCGTVPLARVEQILPRQTTLINTIPAPILPRSRLALLPPGALVLDLASLPGGTDFTAAHELGLQAEHALALPGKCAPKTAGLLIGQTVLALLQERSDPHDKT